MIATASTVGNIYTPFVHNNSLFSYLKTGMIKVVAYILCNLKWAAFLNGWFVYRGRKKLELSLFFFPAQLCNCKVARSMQKNTSYYKQAYND